MKLKNVTFTGADDKTDIEELYQISREYPMVEWGILWYPPKMGQPRYPTKKWIRKFLESNKPQGMNVSLHICGIDAENIGFRIDESEIWGYLTAVNRIQLNFPVKSMDLNYVLALLQRGKYDFRYAINRFHTLNPGRYVILQANKGNKILTACLEDYPAIEFLFDESRGNGKQIVEFPAPIPRKYNGYAGGINPDNVVATLFDLKKIIPEQGEIWIDMESGVRTNEEFDFEKVRSVLKDIKSFT